MKRKLVIVKKDTGKITEKLKEKKQNEKTKEICFHTYVITNTITRQKSNKFLHNKSYSK